MKQTPRRKAIVPQEPVTRIIRDVRDSRLDYFIPRRRAEELFAAGKLVKLQVYANSWSYAEVRR